MSDFGTSIQPRWADGGYPSVIAQRLRQAAEQGTEAYGRIAPGAAVLRGAADYVETLELDDPRVFAIYRYGGGEQGRGYEPGPEATRLLSLAMGEFRWSPRPEVVIAELAIYAVEERIARSEEKAVRCEQGEAEARNEARDLRAQLAEVQPLYDRIAELEALVQEQAGELVKATADVEFLRAAHSDFIARTKDAKSRTRPKAMAA